MARIIKTLEECYGIQHGGTRMNQCSKLDNVQLGKSQKDIAEELGINLDSYKTLFVTKLQRIKDVIIMLWMIVMILLIIDVREMYK